MQFVCGTVVVRAKHHESKTTMEAGFEKSGVTPCPVDTSGGYQQDFWSLWLAENLPPDDKLSRWGVALCCGQNGLLPQILVLPDLKRLFLGSDNSVVLIALGDVTPLKEIALESPVYSLSHFAEREELLVVYETGLRLLTLDGELKWNAEVSDVVSRVALRDGRILDVWLMEGVRCSFDLRDGKRN